MPALLCSMPGYMFARQGRRRRRGILFLLFVVCVQSAWIEKQEEKRERSVTCPTFRSQEEERARLKATPFSPSSYVSKYPLFYLAIEKRKMMMWGKISFPSSVFAFLRGPTSSLWADPVGISPFLRPLSISPTCPSPSLPPSPVKFN